MVQVLAVPLVVEALVPVPALKGLVLGIPVVVAQQVAVVVVKQLEVVATQEAVKD